MMSKIEIELREIMSLVFKVPQESLHETFGPDDTENWDSISTISLINALEDAYSIEFEEVDILEMLNYSLIKLKIEEKLKNI